MGRLPVDHEVFSKICSILMNSEPWLLCFQSFPTLQLYLLLQCPGWAEKNMGLLDSVPHNWGSSELTHYTVTFLHGRNQSPREFLLALSYVTLREVWVMWNYSFLPFLMHVVLDSFAPAVCLNFSSGLLDFHKGALVHEWLSKFIFCGEMMVENFYSITFLVSFLFFPF